MKPAHLCPTKYCRRRRRKKGTHCSTCSVRMWRAENPIKAKLAILRDRAERKKVPFDLTLEWLTAFLADNHYDSNLHHIDRIRTWEGYTMGNLQVLPITENIAKGNRERRGQLPLYEHHRATKGPAVAESCTPEPHPQQKAHENPF